MKKYICVVLAVLLCLSFSSVPVFVKAQPTHEQTELAGNEKEQLSADVIKVSQQEEMLLSVNIKTCEIILQDLKSGHKWSSNPIYTFEDPIASGETKSQMKSQIKVSFLDDIRNIVTVGSFSNSVERQTYEVRTVKENGNAVGVKITYDFKESSQQFKIPIEIKLNKNRLEVSVLYDEIEEYGNSYICDINLLPYFGAATTKTDGYIFIPDGSGAIIKFSESYKQAADYNEPVYGEDSSVNLMNKSLPSNQSIRMPVFGIKQDNSAFLAVIDSGDALAWIHADSNSRMSSFSCVNAKFAYRESDSAGLTDKNSMKRIVQMADKEKASVSPKICYYFLNGDDANYSGMARKYQSYLVDKYQLKKQTIPASSVLMEMFGITQKRSHFLGIPINKSVAATTFEQAENIIKELENDRIENITAVLYGFQDGGYQNKYHSKQKFDSKLGGAKAYKSLLNNVKSSQIYVSYDMIHNYQDASSWFKNEKFIRSLNGITVTRQRGILSSGAWKDSQPWLVLSADHLNKQVDKLLSSLQNHENEGIVYQNMGEELYNNFSPTVGCDRQKMLSVYQNILNRSAQANLKVAGESGNVYLINSANMMYEVPLNSSRFQIASETVPFYAMVLHGYVQLASETLNADADEQIWLRCLEGGVTPTFRITSCDSNELAQTKLNFLFNTKFDTLKENLSQKAKSFSEMQKDLHDKCIVSHLKNGELSVMTYENGTKIVVNQSPNQQSFEGQTIQPQSAIRIN